MFLYFLVDLSVGIQVASLGSINGIHQPGNAQDMREATRDSGCHGWECTFPRRTLFLALSRHLHILFALLSFIQMTGPVKFHVHQKVPHPHGRSLAKRADAERMVFPSR